MEVPTQIEVGTSSLALTWFDGRQHTIPSDALRAACPCAACAQPAGAKAIERVVGGLLAITISDVRLVGDYAVAIEFGPDGHSTGIFPYPLLWSLGEPA